MVSPGPINLKPLQGLKRFRRWLARQRCGPNQPQTLTGIETLVLNFEVFRLDGPINLKPLQGLKLRFDWDRVHDLVGPINLKPLQGLKHHDNIHVAPQTPAQSTSNPYRD